MGEMAERGETKLGGNFHKNTQLIEIILNKQLTTQINIQQSYLIIHFLKKTSPEHVNLFY